MRSAGFIMVSLAVESGSDYIRNKVIGKKITREEIVNTFEICQRAGIVTKALFIIGMPEDTEETLRETIDLIQKLNTTRISMSAAKPLPGTRLFEQCIRDKLLINKINSNMLWSGEVEKNNLYKDKYIHNLLSDSERQYWIKPYNLSIERLAEIDKELQRIAYDKTKNWVERVKKNNNRNLLNGDLLCRKTIK
jgi:radical SAM superfamily enzyme YgiQ (UPF0313 family)